MPENQPTICDTCHERPATYHFIRIIDGVTQKTDLCSQCFEASASPEEKEQLAAMRNARCDYCGEQAAIGSTDTLAMTMGIQKTNHLCFACGAELHRYTGQAAERQSI